MNIRVEEKYNSYPINIRSKLLELRKIILDVADKDSKIDFIGEDLKWGELSFLTKSSGTTIRIDWKKTSSNSISIFVNCQTKLISIYKDLYPNEFEYIGNREIRLPLRKNYSKEALIKCIEMALKYNLIKDDF